MGNFATVFVGSFAGSFTGTFADTFAGNFAGTFAENFSNANESLETKNRKLRRFSFYLLSLEKFKC